MRALRVPMPWFAVLVCVFVIALSPLAARADVTVERDNFSGTFAFAEYSYAVGSIRTFVTVVVEDVTGVTPPQPGGPQPVQRRLELSITRLDEQQGILVDGRVETDQFEFRATGDLSTAHLTANIPFFDNVSGESFDVALDVTWSATGDLVLFPGNVQIREPGFNFVANSISKNREMVATGTIIGLEENFTPFPSTQALIGTIQGGSLLVQMTNPVP